ncbi:MAG TPA: aminotransferase class IV [Candidatus Saccharimonadales bacterium]|nr:aminotransferase class IV [Candidatus Saccharimonadales bacterium]
MTIREEVAPAPASAAATTTTAGRPGVVYINGELKPTDQASISVFDHGLLYGDGVFDTMFATYGYIFKLKEHVERFRRSLRATRMPLPIPEGDLERAILDTVAANGRREAYIKVVATRGVSPEPLMDPRNCTPTLIIFVRPYLSLAGAGKRETGLSTKLTAIQRVAHTALDPRVKNLNYLNLVLAKMEAISANADEALLLDENGFVCEAPGYNLFAVRDGVVITPEHGVLEGITRETVLEICGELGISTAVKGLAPFDLLVADEIFLTSTAAGLVPVTKVDGAPIGDGRPGQMFRRIDAAYDEMQRSGRHGTPITS